jgi:maleylpyruvate isomerase
MTADQIFDPAVLLDRIAVASERLLATAAGFSDPDVRALSLLPGWSRGHVLTHVARNADGGSHLLVWARTGVPTPEYPSTEARAEQIEAGADRSAAALLADVRDSADRFAAEYARMPAAAWQHVVRWTGGQEHPVLRVADSRLAEVLVHHVDLDADYTPADWPEDFTADALPSVVAAFAARSDAPAMRLHATDSGDRYAAGGRGPGAGLAVEGWGPLPRPPFLY